MKTKIARGVIAGEIIGWGYGFRRVGNFYTFTGISEAPNFYGFTPNFRPNFYKSKFLLGALSRTTTTCIMFHIMRHIPLSHLSLRTLPHSHLSPSLSFTPCPSQTVTLSLSNSDSETSHPKRRRGPQRSGSPALPSTNRGCAAGCTQRSCASIWMAHD